MHPLVAGLHARLTDTLRGSLDGFNGGEMTADRIGHGDSPVNYSASTRCTKETAIEPSPTADATRLMLPLRTSPTAKTPGRLVSSRCGGRASGHRAVSRSPADRSGPVLMNACASRARQPLSHAVLGTAPVIRNTWR